MQPTIQSRLNFPSNQLRNEWSYEKVKDVPLEGWVAGAGKSLDNCKLHIEERQHAEVDE